jgi:hypothetical protein
LLAQFQLILYVFRYHVPRSWLKQTKNLLVVFEELGGDVSRIALVRRSVTSICAEASEYHPSIENWEVESDGKSEVLDMPKVSLHCEGGLSISEIKFASFGTPSGTCGSFQHGTCHAPSTQAVLEKVLILLFNFFSLHSLSVKIFNPKFTCAILLSRNA